MKYIFILLIVCILKVSANNFSLFIGTYSEKNLNVQSYLFPKNEFDNNWALSSYTEKLLENKFKNKIKKINLLLRDDFNKNTKKYIESSDIRDRKMSFIHLDSFQNFVLAANKIAEGIITFNLTYVQLGEEPNRIGSEDTFETRYTKSITYIANTALNETYTLEKIYKKAYEKALSNLLDAIIADKNKKTLTALMSDDIYIIIENFKINPSIKKLASEVFKTNKNAQKQLLLMLQENLIRKLRQQDKFSDIVLLYPDLLNEFIFKNWDEYLIRIKEFSHNTIKDKNANIIIRSIKDVCKKSTFDGQHRFVNGYKIQAFLNNLLDKKIKEDDTEINKAIYVSMLARIIIPLKDKQIVNALSLTNDIINKPKILTSQSSKAYDISKRSDTRRDYEIIKVIIKSIALLSSKILLDIEAIVDKRQGKIFIYENFCKGLI